MSEADYRDGEAYGVEWGEQDMRDGLGTTSEWLETFRQESRAGTQWSRAFYLGVLRGYRSIVRTLRDGRWGT